MAVHDIVDGPEPVTLFGVRLPQDRPVGIVSARLTVPEKRLSPVTVIVRLVCWLASRGAIEVVEIVKSWIWKRIVAVWTSEPLVPVMVRV